MGGIITIITTVVSAGLGTGIGTVAAGASLGLREEERTDEEATGEDVAGKEETSVDAKENPVGEGVRVPLAQFTT
jgi:hypothetical protein